MIVRTGIYALAVAAIPFAWQGWWITLAVIPLLFRVSLEWINEYTQHQPRPRP